MAQIEDSLKELDRWFNELPGGTERPKFLSKLATLELCGWLEHRMDTMVLSAGTLTGLDADWVQSKVLKDNHGFTYQAHLRRMLAQVVGESGIAHLEVTFEQASPGKLEQLKGNLTTLSTSRGMLAHTHTGAQLARQQTINSPSWSLNQLRVISKLLDQFEASVAMAFARTIAKP